MTSLSVRKVEPASADVEADGPDEPTGRLSNVCCWSTRAAARELLAPTRATDTRWIYHKEKEAGRGARLGRWLRVGEFA